MLVRTPSFYRAHVPVPALVAHYTAVADASPVPVLLYNYAAFTGVNMAPETVGRLAAHPNIIGMKETSTDGAQFVELAAVVPAAVHRARRIGARRLHGALSAGAAGAILAVACVRPAAVPAAAGAGPRRTVRRGAGDSAAAHAARARRHDRVRHRRTEGRAWISAASTGGAPRPPLGPLPADAIERIRTLLNDTAD